MSLAMDNREGLGGDAGQGALPLTDAENDRVILLLGAPRSGTTWLAKIFDSHPQVLYRHEPDTVDRQLQGVFRSDEVDQHRDATRDYLHRLIRANTLKPAGSLPVFRKVYHKPLQHRLRTGLIYAARAAERLGRPGQMARRIRIPDMVTLPNWTGLKIVIKSVSSLGRVGLFAGALPSARIVFIVRDPRWQIASMMRGIAMGNFGEPPFHEILGTEQAQRYEITAERLASFSTVDRFAWHWAIMNEKAIAELAGLSTGKVVRYQDLHRDPLNVSKEVFAFSGLSWASETEDFIIQSTHFSGRERYYQVYRGSEQSPTRWRGMLDTEDQRRILAVVRQTAMWALCMDECH